MYEKVAPIPFRILKICGLWRPLTFSAWKKILYNSYTVLIITILMSVTMSTLVSLCNMSIKDEVFAENLFMMFAMSNAIFKSVNTLISRECFIEMTNMIYHERWQKSRSAEEVEIRKRFDKTIRMISISFTSAVFVAIILRLITPLLKRSEEVKLPLKAFCPCDIEKSGCYWTMYGLQTIGTSAATLIHAAKDCLISSLLLQTSFQLEVLKLRLINLSKLDASGNNRYMPVSYDCTVAQEKGLMAVYIRDHENIFKFAKILNKSLNVMLFGQLAVTIPNLCTSIFLLSQQNIASMEFVITTQFLAAVTIELFFFCWYGNKVTLNVIILLSLDVANAVNEMDWTVLSATSRRDLLMIMKRASKPILFSVGPLMNMNIESFLSIMKISYSAFSVLQSKEK